MMLKKLFGKKDEAPKTVHAETLNRDSEIT